MLSLRVKNRSLFPPRLTHQYWRRQNSENSYCVFHSHFLPLGGRTTQQIFSERWPGKCSCTEVRDRGEPLRVREEDRHLGHVTAGRKRVTYGSPPGPLVLALEPGSLLFPRLEALSITKRGAGVSKGNCPKWIKNKNRNKKSWDKVHFAPDALTLEKGFCPSSQIQVKCFKSPKIFTYHIKDIYWLSCYNLFSVVSRWQAIAFVRMLDNGCGK